MGQQRPVLEEMVRHGKKFNIGLEAGSKPELHAVLAIQDNPESLIVCTHAQTPEEILAPKSVASTELTKGEELGAAFATGLAIGAF